MPLNWNDQTDQGDGMTVESTELPGIIGWGEIPIEAVQDLVEQTSAVLSSVVECMHVLDKMSDDRS